MNTKGKKTIKIIVNTLLWIFLVFALAMTIFAFIANSSEKDYPVVGDKAWLCVQTDSMEGDSKDYASGGKLAGKKGFKVGDLIISEVLTDETKEDLKVGDVITFNCVIKGKDALNTHRIIEINLDDKTVITQGDKYTNEETKTEKVLFRDIEAKWTGKRVAGLGSFIDFFGSSVGFLCCVVLPLALFFIYELIVLILTIKKMKGKKAPTLSKEDEEEIKKRAVEEYLAKQALLNTTKAEEVKKVSTPKTTAKKTSTNKTELKKAPAKKVASKTTTKTTNSATQKKTAKSTTKIANASTTKKTATTVTNKAPAKKVASKNSTKKTTKTTKK